MKKSPLNHFNIFHSEEMGRAAEGSPIKFGLIRQGIRYAGKGAKYIKKNWKEILGGELAFMGGEQLLKNTKNKNVSSGMDVLNMRHGPKY